jgi:hypothetical protein
MKTRDEKSKRREKMGKFMECRQAGDRPARANPNGRKSIGRLFQMIFDGQSMPLSEM